MSKKRVFIKVDGTSDTLPKGIVLEDSDNKDINELIKSIEKKLKIEAKKTKILKLTTNMLDKEVEIVDPDFIADGQLIFAKTDNADAEEAQMDDNAPLRLNVGGQIFVTTRGTIKRMGEESKLEKMLKNRKDGTKTKQRDESGNLFVDADPKYFRVILNFLRRGKLILDGEVSLEGIQSEAELFGIDSLVKTVAEMREEMEKTSSDELETKNSKFNKLLSTIESIDSLIDFIRKLMEQTSLGHKELFRQFAEMIATNQTIGIENQMKILHLLEPK